MKKFLALVLALMMILALTACAAPAAAPAPAEEAPAEEAPAAEASKLVGVAMPTKDLQRWIQDGDNMKADLEAAGYTVDLQYAANDVATQVSQIENMIASGCEVLVIASIDGEALGTVLEQAKAAEIPVIAYDRLIMNSDAVSYYATFDNWNVGVKQGQYIVDALDLANAGDKTFNIEFITGDPGDNNINFFFDGAVSVLQPYIDAGTLVTPSGQTEKAVVATAGWASDAAQARFENILATYYADGTQLDAVLASNDSTALGVENALASSYTGAYPVITGQDCDVANTKNMAAGLQSMSVFKDTRTLAAKVVEMVEALMTGSEPPINDTETYDNGTGVIPSFLCEPVACTPDMIQELLIDSGYYTADQIGFTAEEAPAEEAAPKLIGVAMPTKDLQRWIQDGDNMKADLEAAGYEVDLQYAANDVPTQVSQLENMIANGCQVLVVASIDGEALGTVLEQAKAAEIPVIAYDRLIMNSDAVSYYATFDNWNVGVKQGEFIVEALDLANAGDKTFNIEFITGDPGDNNINFFFDGAVSVLQPYIDAGTLVTPSGQTEKAVVATAGWASDAAQARFENILATYYADGTQLDAVLCSNDSTALGVENALASSYTGAYPVITGQDCDVANTKNMIAGLQSMSVFKDTRTLAAKVVEMVEALMTGSEPPINDTETYDNGTGVIPSFLCEPVACTPDMIQELLIDSGYYTADQLA